MMQQATLFRVQPTTDAPTFTPLIRVGSIWVKRDDLFEIAGVRGGKVRTCWELARGASGLVTAGARASPQVNIVAHVALELNIPCRVHLPQGKLSAEVENAEAVGAVLVRHSPGYNSVIVARAREDASRLGWTLIPFGMECPEAVTQTRGQVANLPDGIGRILMPVGSGMSLAGVLWGLMDAGRSIPVVGVVVGAVPTDRLDRYAPPDWRHRVSLVPAGTDYHKPVRAVIGNIVLDPHYEAKCARFIQPDDLFWIVGIRQSTQQMEVIGG